MKKYLYLFFSMFKIGLFTFGGGYAMISLLQDEFVEKKKIITHDEFMYLLTIAETTPGPIAINASTYIGYKYAKILGSIFSTIGMCLPSFIIIFVISLFFNRFLDIKIISHAFMGIKVCVIYLIFMAGVKMFKKIEKNAFNITIMAITFIVMILFAVFSIKFSSMFYILISGTLGLFIYLITYFKNRRKEQ